MRYAKSHDCLENYFFKGRTLSFLTKNVREKPLQEKRQFQQIQQGITIPTELEYGLIRKVQKGLLSVDPLFVIKLRVPLKLECVFENINIFGGFQRAMILTLFYTCSSYKPQIELRGRKQFHKGKSNHRDSNNTKQHTKSKEELASALLSLENPIFQLFGDIPRFFSIQSKRKTAISICNNYRKGQQSKMGVNSGEVFYIRNQVICKLSYRQLSQEETSLFLTSFNFVSYLSLINIFEGNNYCAKHKVAR